MSLAAHAPELVVAAAGAALLAAGPRVGAARAHASGAAACGLALALAVATLGAAAPAAPLLTRDGLADLVRLLALGIALAASALAAHDTARADGSRQAGGTLLLAAAVAALGAATHSGLAVGLLALGALGLAPLAGAGASGRLGAALAAVGAILVGAGGAALVVTSGDPLAGVALGPHEEPAALGLALGLGGLALGVVLLVVGSARGLAGEGSAAPASPPLASGAVLLAALGAAALLARATLGLRFVSDEAALPWREGLALLGALVAAGAHVRALRAGSLRELALGVGVGQGALLLLAVGALAPSARPDGWWLGLGGAAFGAQALSGALSALGIAAAALVAEEELGGSGAANVRGLARRNPWLGGALLLALAGACALPLTLGLPARLVLLGAAQGAGASLAVAAALAALLPLAAAALRWTAQVAFTAPPDPEGREPLVTSPGLTVLCVALATAQLALGLPLVPLAR